MQQRHGTSVIIEEGPLDRRTTATTSNGRNVPRVKPNANKTSKAKMLPFFGFIIVVVLFSFSMINTTMSMTTGTTNPTQEEETRPTPFRADLGETDDDPTTTIRPPNDNNRRDEESNNNNNHNGTNKPPVVAAKQAAVEKKQQQQKKKKIVPDKDNKKKQKEKKIRLPDIQLIGAQKSGTTSLAWTLYRKHGVCKYKRGKEAHFFDRGLEKIEKLGGLRYYSGLFEHCSEKKKKKKSKKKTLLSMDATPSYLGPGIARKVREAYDSVGQAESLKIIATLREPVSRELSMYNHHLRKYLENKKGYAKRTIERKDDTGSSGGGIIRNFTEFVNEVSLPSIEKGTCYGLYGKHLEEWFEHFDRKTQILVLSFDELVNDEATYFRRVLNFLYPGEENGTKFRRVDDTVKKNTHDNKIKKADCSDHSKLATAFAKHNEDFYGLLESNPGPEMEQRPFPRFQPAGQCEEEQQQGTNATENKRMN